MSKHDDDLVEELIAIINELTEIYTYKGIVGWLSNNNVFLGGYSPFEVIGRGEYHRVLELVESMNGQSAS